jgi:hypothetical protein
VDIVEECAGFLQVTKIRPSARTAAETPFWPWVESGRTWKSAAPDVPSLLTKRPMIPETPTSGEIAVQITSARSSGNAVTVAPS